MSWLIIAAGLLFIFGSFMMVKPSARDARLAKLRFEATKEGLQMRQFKWESNPKKTGIYNPVMATSYILVRPNSENQGELKFAIVGQKGWETEHLPEGFAWHKIGTFAEAELFSRALEHLQDELQVLEVWDNKVLLIPKESPTATAGAYKTFMQSFL